MNTTALTPTHLEFKDYLEKGIDFNTYMTTLTETVDKLKNGTTEEIEHAQYFPINLQRMKRGLKTTVLSPELQKAVKDLGSRVYWLVITEQWCGDAAQSLALLHRITEAAEGRIEMKMVFRDENPELMDAFLTNGSRSIPKVIQLNEDLNVTGVWGPRPQPAHDIVMDKLAKGESYNDDLHKWYAVDKGVHMQNELTGLLRSAIS